MAVPNMVRYAGLSLRFPHAGEVTTYEQEMQFNDAASVATNRLPSVCTRAVGKLSPLMSFQRRERPDHLQSRHGCAFCENAPTGSTASHFFCEPRHSRFSAPKFNGRAELHVANYAEVDQLESCSRDPIGLFAGFNVFSYVESMPVVAGDPFGFESVYPEDATKVLAFKLMAHYYNGGNLPFRDFAIGLKVDTKISEDAARVLRLIATAECTQRVCAKCESRAGNSSKKLKTQPVSRWLIHTTNVPSDGFYLDIDWFADSNGTCCDCCTIDFVVDYQWRDWADLHPDRYFFPDGLVSWIPADGPYWIDIRWRDNATVRMPCRLGGCDYEESGWPFESPEFMVRAISIPRGPVGGPR